MKWPSRPRAVRNVRLSSERNKSGRCDRFLTRFENPFTISARKTPRDCQKIPDCAIKEFFKWPKTIVVFFVKSYILGVAYQPFGDARIRHAFSRRLGQQVVIRFQAQLRARSRVARNSARSRCALLTKSPTLEITESMPFFKKLPCLRVSRGGQFVPVTRGNYSAKTPMCSRPNRPSPKAEHSSRQDFATRALSGAVVQKQVRRALLHRTSDPIFSCKSISL